MKMTMMTTILQMMTAAKIADDDDCFIYYLRKYNINLKGRPLFYY